MRSAYGMFNRSSQKRKELQYLAVEFGRVKVPGALFEIRWLSKLKCLEVFASRATSEALKAYVNAKDPERITDAEDSILNVLENCFEELQSMLRILRPMGKLTGKLQARYLDLDKAVRKLADTRRELESMSGLAPEVAALRDDLTVYLGSRVPISETAWLGLLHVGVTYPDVVANKKFEVFQNKFAHLDWQSTPDDFLLDYKKIRGAIDDLLSSGATADSINLDVIAAEVDVSNAWKSTAISPEPFLPRACLQHPVASSEQVQAQASRPPFGVRQSLAV